MGYVLPKGSSKVGTSYATTGRFKKKTSSDRTPVKLPEPVRIPPPISSEKPAK